MAWAPHAFMRSALPGSFRDDYSGDESDSELTHAGLTHDESGASNNPERATDQCPQGLSGQLADRPFARQSNSKPNVNTLRDLELLMNDAPHFVFREGIETDFNNAHIGSAVLFEASKIDSGPSGATLMRYLPLVNKGAKTTPQHGSEAVPTPTPRPRRPQNNVRYARGTPLPPPPVVYRPTPTVPDAKDRKLDISPDAKRYIDRARTQRSLGGTVTANSLAPSNPVPDHRLSLTPNPNPTPAGQWPHGRVPVELFETITETLSPRDIRNMRLVCKEFEKKTSGVLFKEVVVPFTAELYDMIEDDVSVRLSSQCKPGSIRQSANRAIPPLMPGLQRGNGDSMYYRKTSDTSTGHGLRVFEGFGPHMNKFGIRLEVTEADLALANLKSSNVKFVEAYHGGYNWPPPGYARFSKLAGLEKIADETPRMTAALAKLENVREIGLSLDSGLGFLGGPDRSHHDMIFDRSDAVFEGSKLSPRIASEDLERLWSHLRQSHDSFTAGVRLSQERLVSCMLTWSRDETVQLPTVASATDYDDSTLWPSFETNGIFSGVDLTTPLIGVIYTTSEDVQTDGNNARESHPPLSPASLTSEQNQWILETGWAQSAFLNTYIMALGDNPQVFLQITKVTISKMSSGLLSMLDRDAFWEALTSVQDVTLLVSPDWRVVGKDEAGCAVTSSVAPSLAVSTFLAVIRRIAALEEIKRLRVGYTQGGENAKGMFGRNHNLMPAPIAALDQLLQPDPDVLACDHLEDVTLVNCWITPQALLELASRQTVAAITGRALTLESVSMTCSLKLERQNYLQVNDVTRQQFRQGCWPWVIEDLRHFLQPVPQEPDPCSIAPSEPQFSPAPYKNIAFASCGYAVLPNQAAMDQSALELGPTMVPAHFDIEHTVHSSEWFRHRAEQLRPHMQSSRDGVLGRIVPWMNYREIAALRMWKMSVGLPQGEGRDAEHDGFPTRGTGRFWGLVRPKVDIEPAHSDKEL